MPLKQRPRFGFAASTRIQNMLMIRIALWIPVLIAGALAIVLRPSPRMRFSLRDLFVVTTITAVVVGVFAVFLRFVEHRV